ncbi:UNVERIFIED_CONTAM: putative protein phosphatase 2C 73 [Sesamum latifolium]|uniref:PPM-type phosphatase domain-containing protein n=1 Tax=Sesamum latifolium TaxID=2727402 RepID=A0AAW2XUY3_9LAMI
MGTSAISAGALVTLQELNPSSPNFKEGASFRVTGKLQDYDLETAVAVIVDGDASLNVDTKHLKLNLRSGSMYQFIGELHIEPNNEEFGCQEDMVFCGVFDGHGPWGHLVAKCIRELMPSLLLCNWQEAVELNGHDADYSLGLDRNKVQFDMWKQSYYKTCAAVDQELQRHPGIDSFYSGSTALALVRQGDLMIVANIGDSRAVLATTSDDGSLVATQLTVDLKPNLPHESKRIAQSRGGYTPAPTNQQYTESGCQTGRQ